MNSEAETAPCVEKHHEEYLKGYGDCYANNESEPPVEDYN